MTDRELMQMALDALELCDPIRVEKEVEALRARLAQPEQEQDDGFCRACKGVGCKYCDARYLAQPEPEPVAQIQVAEDYYAHAVLLGTVDPMYLDQAYLYLAPPQREWHALTQEDIDKAWEWAQKSSPYGVTRIEVFARAIEAKLKEKNNA